MHALRDLVCFFATNKRPTELARPNCRAQFNEKQAHISRWLLTGLHLQSVVSIFIYKQAGADYVKLVDQAYVRLGNH